MGHTGVALRSGFDDCGRQPLGAPETNEPDAVDLPVRRGSGPVPALGDHAEREQTW
jgi:hypothetical protein